MKSMIAILPDVKDIASQRIYSLTQYCFIHLIKAAGIFNPAVANYNYYSSIAVDPFASINIITLKKLASIN